MAKINTIIKIKNSGGGFDQLFPVTKSENIIVDEFDKRLSTKLTEIDSAIDTKISASEKGVANGVATLDTNGTIPVSQLPSTVKELRVVNDIAARNALTAFEGLSVYVKDATGDATVTEGSATYIYDGTAWVKTSEGESLDVVLDWANLQGVPTTLAGFGITDAVNSSDVVDVASANKILKLNSEAKLPADVAGNADTASKLQIARSVTLSGDVSAESVFDGSDDLELTVTLPTISTSGTYTKVTINAKGQVTAGSALVAGDIPNLDWSKITTGIPTTLTGYGITDALPLSGGTLSGPLTLNSDPTQAFQAATKQYVDNAIQGLDPKPNVRVATTGNIVLTGLQAIDGVLVNEGDRVLVKNQDDAVENGVYVASVNAWVRAVDFDDVPDTEIDGGEYLFVQEGTINSDSGWIVVTNSPVTIGTSEIVFTQFSGAGQVIAGVGLAKSGNTIYIENTGVVAGAYTKVTVNSRGQITAGESLAANDIPNLDWSKITTGKPTSSVTDIDDAVTKRHAHDNMSTLGLLGESGGSLTYNGQEIAYAADSNNISLSSTEPTSLPVNGLWLQSV